MVHYTKNQNVSPEERTANVANIKHILILVRRQQGHEIK